MSASRFIRYPRRPALAALPLAAFATLALAQTYTVWRSTEFTHAELADPAISGPAADPDGDGISNLHEYVFVGAPKLTETNLGPTLEIVADTLALTYRERHGLAASGVRVNLEVSDLVTHWVTPNTVTEADREPFPAASYDLVTLLDPLPLASSPTPGRRFLRLRADASSPYTALKAPTAPALSALSPTTYELRWNELNRTETGHRVERLSPSTSTWEQVGTPAADTASWQHTSADYRDGFTYRVAALRSTDNTTATSAPVSLPDDDNDGLPNAVELGPSYAGATGTYATSSTSFSSGESGVSDRWAIEHDFDPLTHDFSQSTDTDNLSDYEESMRGTDPRSADTDEDGVLDDADGWPRDAAITDSPLPENSYFVLPLQAANLPSGVSRLSLAENAHIIYETTHPYPVQNGIGTGNYNKVYRLTLGGTPELLYESDISSTSYSIGQLTRDEWGTLATASKQLIGGPDFLQTAVHFFPHPFSPLFGWKYMLGGDSSVLRGRWNGSLVEAAYHKPDGTALTVAPYALGSPGGASSGYQTSRLLTRSANGHSVTLELKVWAQVDANGHYERIYRHLATALHSNNGTSKLLRPGLVENTVITQNTSSGSITGSLFLPTSLGPDGGMAGYLFSSDSTYAPNTTNPFVTVMTINAEGHESTDSDPVRYLHASPVRLPATSTRPALTLAGATDPARVQWHADESSAGVEWSIPRFWDATMQAESDIVFQDVNNRLEIVGVRASEGCIVANGVVRPLNSLVSGWNVLSAAEINDAGQILAYAKKTLDASGQPIPPAQQVGESVLLIPSTLRVDVNRDGMITGADTNLSVPTSPFRFAPNDDDDNATAPLGEGMDYLNNYVDGAEDLKDLFPVFLDIKQLLGVLPHTTDGITYKLKHEQAALNFVYTSLTRTTAFQYRTDHTSTGYGVGGSFTALDAPTTRITAEGVPLHGDFLNRVKDQDQGVILVEMRNNSERPGDELAGLDGRVTTPLQLVVEKDSVVIAELALPLKSLQVAVRKKGETVPENGVLVKTGDIIEVALDEDYFAKPNEHQTRFTWQLRHLKADGTHDAWADFGAHGKGTRFEHTTQTGGVFQIRALFNDTDEVMYKRKKSERLDLFFAYGQGSKSEPDSVGVCDTQIQIAICREAQTFYASTYYAAEHAVPPQYGFAGFGTSGGAITRCNIFVAHRAVAAGAAVPAINGNANPYPPLANEWAGIEDTSIWPGDPTFIEGWPIMSADTRPQPGWIIAHPKPGDSGHCAITDYDGEGIGAGTSGTVNKNFDEFWDGTSRTRRYEP